VLGSPDAMFELAVMMGPSERVGGRSKDDWIIQAARLGSVSALIHLAKQQETAPKRIEMKLDQITGRFGCGVTSLTELAAAYADRAGAANSEKALRLLQLAESYVLLSAGDLEMLGVAYMQGTAGAPDPRKAEVLLQRAVTLGNERARLKLAIGRVHGLVESMPRDEAIAVLKAAAKRGNVEAAIELVTFLVSELPGETLDKTQSAEIIDILRPVSGGSLEATRLLALLSLKRKIVGIPDAEAWTMLRAGATSGDVVSMREVAHFYVRGGIVQRNSKEFFRWMLAAADKGDREAMHEISAAYETGFGTPVNAGEALRWRENAKKSGMEFATTASPLVSASTP
jgi:TPR repeat protein